MSGRYAKLHLPCVVTAGEPANMQTHQMMKVQNGEENPHVLHSLKKKHETCL